jgi:predicted Zn-dependent protease with MMP-like domain
VSPEEFDSIVADGVRRIPPQFRSRIANVAFLVEQEPRRRSVHDSFRMPDQITIYQGPHERMARSRAHLEELVAETVWHEVAHYFGMDEAQVRSAERRHARLKRRS